MDLHVVDQYWWQQKAQVHSQNHANCRNEDVWGQRTRSQLLSPYWDYTWDAKFRGSMPRWACFESWNNENLYTLTDKGSACLCITVTTCMGHVAHGSLICFSAVHIYESHTTDYGKVPGGRVIERFSVQIAAGGEVTDEMADSLLKTDLDERMRIG